MTETTDTGDDSTADRHADLDVGEYGGMADSDYYDRISATGPPAREHGGPCIYCEHGPYCLTCPPPPVIADDAPVCGRCREAITRSEIAADPYYRGDWDGE